jgi:hypothetical protein
MSTHSFQIMVRKSFQMAGQSGDVAGAQMTLAQRSEAPPQSGSYNEGTGCGYLSARADSHPPRLPSPKVRPTQLQSQSHLSLKQSMMQHLLHLSSQPQPKQFSFQDPRSSDAKGLP